MQKVRKSNFELLRIIAMIMVVTLHYMGHGGALDNTRQFSLNFYYANFVESFSIYAVNLYVLISGYFLCGTDFGYNRVLKIWLQIFFYSTFLWVVLVAVGYIPLSMKALVKVLLPVISNQYSFATAYVVLLLLVPFLNKLINGLDRVQYRRLIITMFVFFVVLGVGFPLSTSINSYFLNFVFLYFLAAYFRRFGFVRLNKYVYLAGYVVSSLAIFGGRMLAYRAGSRFYQDMFLDYHFVLVVVGASCLFLFIKEVELQSRLINKISGLTFGVYLIHDNIHVRSILYSRILKTGLIHRTSIFIPASIITITGTFAVYCLIEYARKRAFEVFRIEQRVETAFNSLAARFGSTVTQGDSVA